MTLSDYHILEHSGAGPLRFGMVRAEIENILGPPSRSSTRGGGLRLSWDGSVSTKLERSHAGSELTLCEIGFSRNGPRVIWCGYDVFGNFPDFVRKACAQDAAPLSGFGVLLLRDLGLSITGFDGPEEDRAITVFPKGRWDNALDGMEPFAGF